VTSGAKAQSLWALGGTAEAVPYPKAIYETSTKELSLQLRVL